MSKTKKIYSNTACDNVKRILFLERHVIKTATPSRHSTSTKVPR